MTNRKAHWQYLRYVLRHKYFVLRAGLVLGVSIWQLLVHDLSKFSRAEWGPYVTNFYVPLPTISVTYEKRRRQRAFDRAWLHHQHANPHHWQHYILRQDDGTTKVLSMPRRYIAELVADWCGAGRAISRKWEAGTWYEKNKDKIVLEPYTRLIVEDLLADATVKGIA